MKILERFRKPKSGKQYEIDEISAMAKRCLDSADGEVLLNHLIEQFKLDKPTGSLPVDEANWVNGTQHVVKYLLALINCN